MDIEFVAWATTSVTMPSADPGVTVTKANVVDGRHRHELGVVAESDPQSAEWGVGPDDSHDLDAFDSVVKSLGYQRVEPWQASGNAWAARVVPLSTT